MQRDRCRSGQPRVAISGPGCTLAQALTAELDVVMASQSSAQAVMQQVRTAVQAVGLDRSQLAALTGAGIPEEQARPALDEAAAQVAMPAVEIVDTGDVVQEFRGLGKFDLGASQQLLLFVFLSSLTGAATLIQARRLPRRRRRARARGRRATDCPSRRRTAARSRP